MIRLSEDHVPVLLLLYIFAHDGKQFFDEDRLFRKCVHAGFHRCLFVLFADIRGHGDDRQGAPQPAELLMAEAAAPNGPQAGFRKACVELWFLRYGSCFTEGKNAVSDCSK